MLEQEINYKPRVDAIIASGRMVRRNPNTEGHIIESDGREVRFESWEFKDQSREYKAILGRVVGEDLGCTIHTVTFSGGLWLHQDFEIQYTEGLVAQNISYSVPLCERGVDQNQLFYPQGQQRSRRVPIHLIEQEAGTEVAASFKKGANRIIRDLEDRLGLGSRTMSQFMFGETPFKAL